MAGLPGVFIHLIQLFHLFFEAFLAQGMGDLIHLAGFDVHPFSAVRAFDVHQLGEAIVLVFSFLSHVIPPTRFSLSLPRRTTPYSF